MPDAAHCSLECAVQCDLEQKWGTSEDRCGVGRFARFCGVEKSRTERQLGNGLADCRESILQLSVGCVHRCVDRGGRLAVPVGAEGPGCALRGVCPAETWRPTAARVRRVWSDQSEHSTGRPAADHAPAPSEPLLRPSNAYAPPLALVSPM